MEKKIEKHSEFIKNIIPSLCFILIFGAVLLYQYRNKAEKSIIVAKEQVLQSVDLNNESSILASNKRIKALSTEKGLDSLINEIK